MSQVHCKVWHLRYSTVGHDDSSIIYLLTFVLSLLLLCLGIKTSLWYDVYKTQGTEVIRVLEITPQLIFSPCILRSLLFPWPYPSALSARGRWCGSGKPAAQHSPRRGSSLRATAVGEAAAPHPATLDSTQQPPASQHGSYELLK